MVTLLGGSQAIAKLKKREVAEAIMKAWPVESLGPLKGRGTEERAPIAIEYMAMFLRPVEAQFGGAKPRRAPENSNVAAEGSNGSTLTGADDFETEPVEGQTV